MVIIELTGGDVAGLYLNDVLGDRVIRRAIYYYLHTQIGQVKPVSKVGVCCSGKTLIRHHDTNTAYT